MYSRLKNPLRLYTNIPFITDVPLTGRNKDITCRFTSLATVGTLIVLGGGIRDQLVINACFAYEYVEYGTFCHRF